MCYPLRFIPITRKAPPTAGPITPRRSPICPRCLLIYSRQSLIARRDRRQRFVLRSTRAHRTGQRLPALDDKTLHRTPPSTCATLAVVIRVVDLFKRPTITGAQRFASARRGADLPTRDLPHLGVLDADPAPVGGGDEHLPTTAVEGLHQERVAALVELSRRRPRGRSDTRRWPPRCAGARRSSSPTRTRDVAPGSRTCAPGARR